MGLNWPDAYAECRSIARREAKNFYYAFVALPEARRNAICAIYAFMRQADDLADEKPVARGAPQAIGCVAGAWRGMCRQACDEPIRCFWRCAMLSSDLRFPFEPAG